MRFCGSDAFFGATANFSLIFLFLESFKKLGKIQFLPSFNIRRQDEENLHASWSVPDETMINPMPKKVSVIIVDVDDTLIRSFGTKQIPIPITIQYVRDMFHAGNLLYCWSRGGAQYSCDVATKLGVRGVKDSELRHANIDSEKSKMKKVTNVLPLQRLAFIADMSLEVIVLLHGQVTYQPPSPK